MKSRKVIQLMIASVILTGIAFIVSADEKKTESEGAVVETESVVTETEQSITETVNNDADSEVIFTETDETSYSEVLEETECSDVISTETVVSEETEPAVTELTGEAEESCEEFCEESTEASEESQTTDKYPFEDFEYWEAESEIYLLADYDVKKVPDPDSEILVSLPAGTVISYVGFNPDSPWVQVEVEGERGYINSSVFQFVGGEATDTVCSDEEMEECTASLLGWN